ncbi:BirA family transcriptional regulator, biotin operon repressor / biotin-[acetyl-CoA-carboxylase] ligase [Selenomonas sp. GACV-9]|uniref:biotin--[acetyl-CoA-carboxylase] ligase n=1 Tax=Selenomonas sp. GACV-9 TaxID=3158782 RepID=UPI0008E77A58|nr:BirA family transcriptional regulator, biotin operon repressor / biotin-[acetyl-CoA-carboxylase] ligase [Selenomonas ruminantium]
MRTKILEILRSAGDAYISGEEMASRLGVSRTAVWKHIRELRENGYDIVSHSRSGYSLRETPDRLLPSEIRHGLKTQCVGRDIHFEEVLDSTNNVAKRLAAAGAADGTIVVAEQQTGGKGRLERQFFSPAGKGIWFSAILRPPFMPQEAPKCTLMAAVAVSMAMERFGLKAGIKWPNDLLYENRKLVGILTEMSAEMDRINHIIIGTGINVNILPEEFPADIRETATSLQAMNGGRPLPRVKFFQAVLEAMDELYAEVLANGFAPIMEAWRKYSITLGQEVRVIGVRNGEEYTGTAVDIDDDGALLVDAADGRHRVLAGDVSIRPKK